MQKSGNPRQRNLALLVDVGYALVVAVLLSLALPKPAYAYVDPSVMTYTIQAIAGVAVALGAVAGVALRRTRKWLFKVLKIDENAGKQIDAEFRRLTHEEASRLDAETPNYTESYAIQDSWEPKWRVRFGISFLVVLFCGFTLGISAPLELVAGNASSLTFGLRDVAPVMAVTTALATMVISLLVSALKGKAFRVISLFLCCCGVAMCIQSLFLNTGLILSDNQDIDWIGMFLPSMIVSAVVWIVVLVVPQLLARKNWRRASLVAAAFSFCAILVQTIGVGSLFFSTASAGDSIGPSVVTQKGIYEVSDKSNVIVLIVDHFDEHELEKLLDQDPHILDFLPNSTVYRNATEMMTPTEFALPYMVTGVLPEIDEDINGSYLCRRYTEGTFLQAMEQAGYDVGIYTNALRLYHLSNAQSWDSVGSHTENIHPNYDIRLNWRGTVAILTKASLYRNLPWVLKPRFSYTTPDLDNRMVARDEEGIDRDAQPYVLDDIAFYHDVLDEGLSIDQGDSKGKFRLIHFDGNHSPWTKNENVEEVEHSPEGRDADAIGSLKIVEAYIQDLKDLGVYDKSTVIVTADHGDWETNVLPEKESVPILIVKPATDGREQNPPVFSDAPVGHEDMFATILEAMGADGGHYGSTLAEIEAQYADDPAARLRETYMAAANKKYSIIIDLFLYTVQGDVRNWNDWTYTGITWHVEDEE